MSTPPPSAVAVAEAFARFGPPYLRWVQGCVGEGEVSPARMRLLAALKCGGPQIMSGLSDRLGVTARNVTALVDGLEKEGLVRRRPHESDRRATIVEATEGGLSLVASGTGGHLERVAELFAGLTHEDQNELLRIVEQMRGWLGERGV